MPTYPRILDQAKTVDPSGTYAQPAGAWSAGTYSINQVVTYNGSTYRSKANGNTATPGTDATKWESWGGSSVVLFLPETYGAKADWRQVTDAAMTSGLATLTSTTAAFTSQDVGKSVSVQGAGAAGVDLVTTIAAVTNSTTATLSATAGTTVTGKYLDLATDDTAAIQQAIDAAVSAGGGVVQLGSKVYVANTAPRTDRGVTAILCPLQATVRTTMTIQGMMPAEHNDMQSKPVTTIKTFYTGGSYNSGAGVHQASVLGAQGTWAITVKNLSIVVPKNPAICGIDFSDILRCEFDGVNIMPDWRGAEVGGSATNSWTYGLSTKGGANYDKVLAKSLLIAGFWTGWICPLEHVCGVDVVIHRCGLALALQAATHAGVFQKLSLEHNNIGLIGGWDPTGGTGGITDLSPGSGVSTQYPLVINLLDLEANTNGIRDAYNKLRGTISFYDYSNSLVRDSSALSITGGAGLKVTNLRGIGNGKIVASANGAVDGLASGTTVPTVGTGATGFSGCLVFDGSGSGALGTVCCVNLGTGAAQGTGWNPTGTQAWTVEARFKRTRTGTQEAVVAMWSTAAGQGQYILQIDSTNHLQAVIRGNGGTNYIATGASTVTDTNWHSGAMSYDGSTLRVFLDGVADGSVGSVTFATSPNTSLPLLLGAYADGTVPFIGSIDEARISKVARYTATYTPATAPFSDDGNTIGLWHLDALY